MFRFAPRAGSVRVVVALALAALLAVALVLWLRHRGGGSGGAAAPQPAGAAVATEANRTSAASSAAPAGAAVADARRAVEAALQLQNPRDRAQAYGRALQRWLELDFASAFEFVRRQPRGTPAFSQGLLLALDLLGRRDADAALRLASELATTREEQAFFSAIFARLAETNPAAAAARLALVPAGLSKENAVRALTDAWAAKDPDAALAWARKLEGPERSAAVETAIRNLVTADPLRALQLAQQELSGEPLQRTLSVGLQQLAASDPQSAAAIVPLLPAGPVQTMAAAELAQTWAARNPSEAVAWAAKLSADSGARTVALSRALETWATSDPAAAAAYVQTMANDPARIAAAVVVAGALTRRDPQAAAAWALTFAAGDGRGAVATKVVDAWAQREPEAAARWAATQPTETFAGRETKALNAAVSYWVLQDAAAARTFVGQLPAAQLPAVAEFVAPLLAQRDPAGTMAWALALPDSAARMAAARAAYRRWLDNAPGDARTWLGGAAVAPEVRAVLQKQP